MIFLHVKILVQSPNEKLRSNWLICNLALRRGFRSVTCLYIYMLYDIRIYICYICYIYIYVIYVIYIYVIYVIYI